MTTAWQVTRRAASALAAALACALVTGVAQRPELRLEAGSTTWRRVVRGATAKGLLAGQGGLLLPGLPRSAAGELCLQVEPATHDATRLAVRVDAGAPVELAVAADAMHCLALPAAVLPGLRLDLSVRGAPLRLRELRARVGPSSLLAPLLAALLAAALALGRPASGIGLALASGALSACAAWCPLGAWLWPQSVTALAPAFALGLVGAALAWRTARRRALGELALVAASVVGCALRLLFLTSTGSWDTEYWKAWMQRSVTAGVTQAYGPADALPAGRALAQLRGDETLWKVERGGRAFVVDYPPLAMALWAASWRVVTWAWPEGALVERENVAVKLPALVGDVLALVALLWACGPDRRRAWLLGALYWASPTSWLSSATLGYFDGSLPALLLVALVLAGRGRAAGAGFWLALAALVKPTALIAAPACALALARAGGRRALFTAACSGLALGLLVALPFVQAGTLVTMLVHCARLFFQERLSGGYPNLGWLLGHALTARDGAGWLGPVAFAPVALVPFPVRPLGTLLFALGALHLARGQGPGAREACRVGALLFLLYGMVAVGVHENHPHPLFLLLLFAGLPHARARLVAAGAAVVYVGDMLALSGLGRFHGPRFLWLLPWAERAESLRMAAGLDLTLVLALVHLPVFALALGSWRVPERATLPTGEGGRA